jgi:DNA-directed RNA polymerase specialized sigma24 family protein
MLLLQTHEPDPSAGRGWRVADQSNGYLHQEASLRSRRPQRVATAVPDPVGRPVQIDDGACGAAESPIDATRGIGLPFGWERGFESRWGHHQRDPAATGISGVLQIGDLAYTPIPCGRLVMEAAAAPLVRLEELAAQTRIGDRQAFVTLYEPDFDGVFDLVLRTMRDREVAAAVLRAALEKAWNVFREQGAPYDVSGWLYAHAREAALSFPAKRRPAARDREALDYTQVECQRLSDPSCGFDKDLMELVWDTAVALDREDYSLLDLHVRRDLSVETIAEHLGLPADQVKVRLSRLCDSVNDSVGATLLATRARHNCAGLDAELSGLPSNVRRPVRRHVQECVHCRETKERFVPATEVLGSFALMTSPPGLREQTAHVFLRIEPARRFLRRRGLVLERARLLPYR